MRTYWLAIFLLFQISCLNTNNQEDFKLQKGDILFQDLDTSPLCNAIELVSSGYNGANFSHIGIIVELGDPFCQDPNYNYSDHIRILESLPDKVRTTSIDSFLNRSFDKNYNPKVIVGRLKPEYRHAIQNAISFSKQKLGMKYDHAFLMNNDSYYCSELIYKAFEKDSIFKLEPMTFLHPQNHETLQTWKDYYAELQIEIPENELGINPGIMSLSKKIEIVHLYGIPNGMRK